MSQSMAEVACVDCGDQPASNLNGAATSGLEHTISSNQNAGSDEQPPVLGASQDQSAVYDPLDASTFLPPPALPSSSVTIEFCDRVSEACKLTSYAFNN